MKPYSVCNPPALSTLRVLEGHQGQGFDREAAATLAIRGTRQTEDGQYQFTRDLRLRMVRITRAMQSSNPVLLSARLSTMLASSFYSLTLHCGYSNTCNFTRHSCFSTKSILSTHPLWLFTLHLHFTTRM